MGSVELFLSTGKSCDLVKSTPPESVMNKKLKSAPRIALQGYVTEEEISPSFSIRVMASIA